MLEQNAVVITEKNDLKPICLYLCLLWGMCNYSDQHVLQPYCQLVKNSFCIKPQEFDLEDMNAQIRQWFGTVGWFVQVLGGCSRQESDYPTFLSFGSP